VIAARAAGPDAAAFAAFGAFIDAPPRVGERRLYSEWLAPVPGLRLQVHTNRVAAATAPLTVTRVERHPHAAQAFVPLDTGRYLVTVLPSTVDGAPDLDAARAFVLPPTLGVVYRPGVWHAGITALDREATFVVLMWRGAVDDDAFADVPPLLVEA
jgi:ureidoglycolate lyase